MNCNLYILIFGISIGMICGIVINNLLSKYKNKKISDKVDDFLYKKAEAYLPKGINK